jgi:hypothetical protein
MPGTPAPTASYERRGFGRTGREGRDDFGQTIVHYARGL